MTATLTADELSLTDELAALALKSASHALFLLCMLGDTLTSEERHPIRNDLTAVIGMLLSPPLRPSGAEDALLLRLEEVAADAAGS